MANIQKVQTTSTLYKSGQTASAANRVVVGDIVKFVIHRTSKGQTPTYVNLTLAYVDHTTKTYGWDRTVANQDYTADQIERPANDHAG